MTDVHHDHDASPNLDEAFERITAELRKVVVGQDRVVEQLLIGLLAGGHCLLVGVPGLAKTLIVRSLAEVLGLSFHRIQFTPDLMPADITGTEVIQEDRVTGVREFRFLKGPIFAGLILADEINRSSPKTQAALLEAMQEHQVTIGGVRHPLPSPFFVLATQNPIEQEGTYPLPEAQRDRFLFEIRIDYPDESEEFEIMQRTTGRDAVPMQTVFDSASLQSLQQQVRDTPVADHVIQYAMALTRQTRVNAGGVPAIVRDYIAWGAGPRATQSLLLGAKARAALRGRACAGIEDVRELALPVLRHRLVTNFRASAEGVSPEAIIQHLLETTPSEGTSASLIERLTGIVRSP